MSKPYRELRKRLAAEEIDNVYLAGQLGRSPCYVSTRLMAHDPWTQEDMYKIMDMINAPYDDMPLLFPRKGIDVERRRCSPDAEKSKKLAQSIVDIIMYSSISAGGKKP